MPEERNAGTSSRSAAGQIEIIVGSIKDLLAQRDFESSISVTLRRMIDYFQSDRAYIFEIDWENDLLRNTYEECANGVSAQITELCALPLSVISAWIEYFNKEKTTLHIRDVDKIPTARKNEREVLKAQGIKELYVTPFFFDGRLSGFLGIDDPAEHVRDVNVLTTLSYFIFTEMAKEREHRKKTEAVENYQRLLSNIPGGIVLIEVTDGLARPTYFSDGFCRMMEMSEGEAFSHFGGLGAHSVIFPDDRKRVYAEFTANYVAHEDFSLTFRIKNRQAQYKWVQINASVLYDDGCGKVSYYLVCTDVSAEKEAQARLERTEEYYRAALSNSDIDMWEYDLKRRCIVKGNTILKGKNAWETIEAVPESQIKSGDIHPGSVEVYRSLYRRLHEGAKDPSADVRVRREDGVGWRWARIKYTTPPDGEDSARCVVAVVTDVTEQKNAEMRYENELKRRDTVYSDALTLSVQLNLTTGVVEYASDVYASLLPPDRNFDEMLLRVVELIPNRQQRADFLAKFASRSLTTAYNRGDTTLEYEYQKTVAENTVRWVRTTARMLVRPGTNEIIVFFTLNDTHDEHMSKELLNCVAQEDYEYVAYIDAPHNSYVMFASFGKNGTPLPPPTGDDYYREITLYAEKFVVEEEVSAVIQMMGTDFVISQLESGETFEFTAHVKETNGDVRLKKLKYSYMDRENKILRLSRVDITDIYEQLTENQRLRELSQRDGLTGLYNKKHFCVMLETAVALSCEKWLFFIDIDNFKGVNDVLGHMTGDQALRDTAATLREVFSETGMIGRFGGDEFFVLLTEVSEEEALAKAREVCQSLKKSYGRGKKRLEISGSVGLCKMTASLSPENALKHADEALYRAKALGKGRFVLYR
ncbi:MAG: diguanylate cyclase [Cloacibacillus sp.]